RTVVYEIAPRDEHLQPLPVPVDQPLQALYGATRSSLLVVEHGRTVVYEIAPRDEHLQPLPVPVDQPLQALYGAT
ncbi:hypothetical protein C7E17_26480, partial [Stenotrophomonas maltophilia]